MRTWMGLGALVALLTVVGCSPQNVSGTYMAHDGHGALLLQLTESQGQQVMGNMILVQLLPNGRTKRTDISITGGAVDANGHTLVLTMRPNELFAQARNVSGEISGTGIDLVMPGVTMHLFSSTPQDFDIAINDLAEAGKQQEQLLTQAKQVADDVKRIAGLTQALTAYNTRILSSAQGPEVLRKQEEQLVAAARKNLAIMLDLVSKHQDYPADQVRYRIGQLAFQMGQIKFQISQVVEQGQAHLADLDDGLAKSSCYANISLQGCDSQGQEKVRYTATRAKVKKYLSQLSSDLQKNESAIEAINIQAGN